MLVAVDGTGPWFDDTYANEMVGSFVNKIYSQSPESSANKHYRRGPTLLGFETGPIAYDFAGIILKSYEASKKAGTEFKLFLTGYSRGAASVIGIAYLLQQYKPEIEIEFMALFDAVDRSPIVTADSITNNVKMCYHAIRDPNAGSRTYFGNCGLTIDSQGIMVKRIFFATHAGMGGIPWTGDHPTKKVSNPSFDTAKWVQQNRFNPRDVLPPPDAFIEVPLITEDQDKAGSGEVQKWMWDAMKKYGMLK